jgi:hypothetical protein
MRQFRGALDSIVPTKIRYIVFIPMRRDCFAEPVLGRRVTPAGGFLNEGKMGLSLRGARRGSTLAE